MIFAWHSDPKYAISLSHDLFFSLYQFISWNKETNFTGVFSRRFINGGMERKSVRTRFNFVIKSRRVHVEWSDALLSRADLVCKLTTGKIEYYFPEILVFFSISIHFLFIFVSGLCS